MPHLKSVEAKASFPYEKPFLALKDLCWRPSKLWLDKTKKANKKENSKIKHNKRNPKKGRSQEQKKTVQSEA